MGNIQLFCDILLRVSKSGTNSPYAVAAINLIEIHKITPDKKISAQALKLVLVYLSGVVRIVIYGLTRPATGLRRL